MTKSGMMLAVLAVAVTAGAQTSSPNNVKDDLFNGTEIFAKGASDVTEITMDPDTLGMVAGKDSHKAHNMVLNVVRTYEYDKPGMYNIADVEAFRNKLNTGDWHCSVHTRSLKTGESTDICEKHRTDDLKETAIITVEPKELTFIHTIRRRGPGESEVGDMPLSMLMGMHGLPTMAMVDPEAMVDMAVLRAQLGAMGGQSMGFSHSMPKSFVLDIPSGSEIQNDLDGAQKSLDGAKAGRTRDKTTFLLAIPDGQATPPPAPPEGKPDQPQSATPDAPAPPQ